MTGLSQTLETRSMTGITATSGKAYSGSVKIHSPLEIHTLIKHMTVIARSSGKARVKLSTRKGMMTTDNSLWECFCDVCYDNVSINLLGLEAFNSKEERIQH